MCAVSFNNRICNKEMNERMDVVRVSDVPRRGTLEMVRSF